MPFFTGSASLDAKLNGKIALRTLFYFISTSLLNAILGVILVQLIHPGDPSIKGQLETSAHMLDDRKNTLMDNFLDLGRYSWFSYTLLLNLNYALRYAASQRMVCTKLLDWWMSGYPSKYQCDWWMRFVTRAHFPVSSLCACLNESCMKCSFS